MVNNGAEDLPNLCNPSGNSKKNYFYLEQWWCSLQSQLTQRAELVTSLPEMLRWCNGIGDTGKHCLRDQDNFQDGLAFVATVDYENRRTSGHPDMLSWFIHMRVWSTSKWSTSYPFVMKLKNCFGHWRSTKRTFFSEIKSADVLGPSYLRKRTSSNGSSSNFIQVTEADT